MANSKARRRRAFEACSVERYTLDLRNVNLTPSYQFLVGTRLVPLRRGQNVSDYEIIEDELPLECAETMRKNIIARERSRGTPQSRIDEVMRLPIGISAHFLPAGAAIVRGYIA
ncbi:MAG: hypothetical protein AB1450_04895 [Pseudomonadota bacterium]